MPTLLLITADPSLANALQAILEGQPIQLTTQDTIRKAAPLLARGACDGILLDLDLTDTRAIRVLQELVPIAAGLPIIITSGQTRPEWQEEAIILGVETILPKPPKARVLLPLLHRLFSAYIPAAKTPAPAITPILPAPPNIAVNALRSLESLRKFSTVLSSGLDLQTLLRHVLQQLREILGINRAAIFLRKQSPGFSAESGGTDDPYLAAAHAVGLDPTLLEVFTLSLQNGIAAHLSRHGRILRADTHESLADRDITRQFAVLGAKTAVPILDRENLVGVAILDDRLSGEPIAIEELSLVFHLLEDIGLAIRNAWLHDETATNRAIVQDILGQLDSGCIVFSGTLAVLHANTAALRFLIGPEPTGLTTPRTLRYAHLPQNPLGSQVYLVSQTGEPSLPFECTLPTAPDRTFRAHVSPFRGHPTTKEGCAVLLLLEDITDAKLALKFKTEEANMKLVRSMAEHLAHEVGNSLTALSTRQQMFDENINDPDFQEDLSAALSSTVRRIGRMSAQMAFLAREWKPSAATSVRLSDIIVDAFHEAHTYHPGTKVAQLNFDRDKNKSRVPGDPKALRHAFSEIILNALQSNPEAPSVAIKITETRRGTDKHLEVELRDTGKGFTPEAASRATEPFYSTRAVGLGVGLTVTRQIIEGHHGQLEIAKNRSGDPAVVLVRLPIEEIAS